MCFCVRGVGPTWAARDKDRPCPWRPTAACTPTSYSTKFSTLWDSTTSRSAPTETTLWRYSMRTLNLVRSQTETKDNLTTCFEHVRSIISSPGGEVTLKIETRGLLYKQYGSQPSSDFLSFRVLSEEEFSKADEQTCLFHLKTLDHSPFCSLLLHRTREKLSEGANQQLEHSLRLRLSHALRQVGENMVQCSGGPLGGSINQKKHLLGRGSILHDCEWSTQCLCLHR